MLGKMPFGIDGSVCGDLRINVLALEHLQNIVGLLGGEQLIVESVPCFRIVQARTVAGDHITHEICR